MKTLTSCVVLFLLMASTVAAQTATGPTPDAAELTRLLNDFLAGASRNDVATHDRFWAEDLIYTRSAGVRVSKADIMRSVRSAPAPKPDDPKVVYTAEDIRIQQYGDTAVVAFRLVATTQTGETKQVQHLLNCGTFVKRNGKWQVVAWQSTRMPRTDEENTADVRIAVAAFRQALLKADKEKLKAATTSNFVWFQKPGQQVMLNVLADQLGSKELKPFDLQLPTESVWLYGETAMYTGESSTARYTITLTNQSGNWKVAALNTIN
ncbi:MAG TPA: nuclear transport factor 2 family protein [Pyrinomonadaceae bacterium]|nr:nuclear transport factor 2 family protein [Pyrinomonadaceae bacterium]